MLHAHGEQGPIPLGSAIKSNLKKGSRFDQDGLREELLQLKALQVGLRIGRIGVSFSKKIKRQF